MPFVPGYDDQKVRTRPLPAVRVNPAAPIEAFGGGPHATASFGAGSALADIGFKVQEDANSARLSEERRALNDIEKKLIHDEQTGAKWKLGKNAIGVGQQVEKDFDAFVTEREKGLANQSQREAFRGMVDARRAYLRSWSTDHEGEQLLVHRVSEREAGIQSSKDRAARDPKTAALELEMLRDNVADIGEARGWGPEALQATLRKEESDFHAGVIRSILAGSRAAEARAYYESAKGSINAELHPTFEKVLQDAGDDDLALAIEGEVFRPRNPKDEPPTSRADAIGRAGTEIYKLGRGKDAKLNDRVMNRVERRWADEDAGRKAGLENLYENFTKEVEAGRDPRRSDPLGYTRLTSQMRDALAHRASEQKDDSEVWLEFYHEHAADPLAIARMSRSEFDRSWARMSPAHRSQAEKLREEGLKTLRDGSETQLHTWRTGIQKEIERQAKRNDIMPFTMDGLQPDEKKAYGQKFSRFEESVEQALLEFQQGNKDKRRATPEEAKEIVAAEVAKEITVDGEVRRVSSLNDNERKRARIPYMDYLGGDSRAPGFSTRVTRYFTHVNRINNRRGDRGKPTLKSDDLIMRDKVERLLAAEKLRDFDLYESILNETE